MGAVLLLLTHGHPTFERNEHPNLGRLIQPRHYPRVADTAAAGLPWAADNDAFNGWGTEAETRWLTMLDAIEGLPGCRFVVCPDVVGERGLTDMLFEEYAPLVMSKGLPVAYVLQEDGVERESYGGPPWGSMDALFLGGATDEFKLGAEVEALVAEAKRRGKWVHMGRVNTQRRVRYAKSIGCDSIDGTTYSRWIDRWLGDGLAWVSAPTQMRLGAQ